MPDPDAPRPDDEPSPTSGATGGGEPPDTAGAVPSDPDATQAHDVEQLFETSAGHDDERVAELAGADPAAGEGGAPEPVWADDLTAAIPAVPPPAADATPTTWVPPVAATQAIPPTPPEPPDEPAEPYDEEPGGLSGGKIALIVGVVILVALVIGVAAFLLTADDDGSTGDPTPVALEGADDPGTAPFTADAAESIDLARVRELADIPADIDEPDDGADDPTGRVRTGTDPGLYTAPMSIPICDRGRIERDLAAAPSTQSAWAGIEGVPPADVTPFLESLTPVALLGDTRVTDHRYDAGRAVATQAVLQAGTVVLVDDRGLPRVRCASGSPLLPPIEATDGITVSGTPWAGFSLDRVQTIRAGQPVEVLVLVDLASGEPFSRPVGTDGGDDAPIGGATTTTTGSTTTSSTSTSTSTSTTTTSTSTTTSTTTPPPTDVTAEGDATASSVVDPFSASLAIDGDTTTSWFGNGSTGAPSGSIFTWEHGNTVEVDRITVVGNGANADSALRTGTGFESVTVEVLDNGTVTYSETFGLPGTPDPTINARPSAPGNTVRLTFTGPEGTTQAGFGELTIIAA